MDLLPIENKIYEIRGYKVMFDFDYLAANYDQLPNIYGKRFFVSFCLRAFVFKIRACALLL